MSKGFLIFFLLFSQISWAQDPTPALSSALEPLPSPSPVPKTLPQPITTQPAVAPVETPAPEAAAVVEASPKASWTQRMIENNITISNWFDGVAEGLDLFLAGKQLTKKKNNSRLRFDEWIRSIEGEEVTHDFAVGVLLRLPNLEEYWQVKFTSYDELKDRRQSQSDYLRRNPRPENYGASVGLFRKLGDVRVAFQPRVELQDPISVSQSLSFESVAEMKNYSINPKLELYAVADKGTGVYWALNFNFNIDKDYSLTLINSGDYVSQTHVESVTNGFSFQHVITDYTALGYGTNFFSTNREKYHLEGYSFFATWSHTIYKNILDYSITPHLDFFREYNFHGRAGISVNVGVSF